MHRLRRDGMDEDVLWFGHEELVEAISRSDHEQVHAAMHSYYAHALAWADRLEAREAEGDAPGPPDSPEVPEVPEAAEAAEAAEVPKAPEAPGPCA